MEAHKELKRGINLGLALIIVGCLGASMGGIDDSVWALVFSVVGLLLVIVGFVIAMPKIKKLKALKQRK